ncbi:hypothetical protein CGSHi22121_04105 [Haemophilus influenzae 22.1-21]|nr:hypothetical protein CGSHi22121_04105 [Haemophilus influenzae 22.1-21]
MAGTVTGRTLGEIHFRNGRRRRKRAVNFLIVFQTLRQKDRGKRQSIVSVEIIHFFTALSFPLYLFVFLSCLFFDLNDEESQ